MQAQGEHLLVRLPSKRKATEGGLLLPDNFGQLQAYGRVLSAGQKVADFIDVQEGDIVCFDAMGKRDVELDPSRDSDLTVLHATQVFFKLAEQQLDARKLPIP